MLRGLFHSVASRFLPFPLDGLVPVLCYVCVSLECGGGRNATVCKSANLSVIATPWLLKRALVAKVIYWLAVEVVA